MPIVALLIGVLLVVTGLNNRLTGPATPNLVALLKEDIQPSDGSSGFGVWVLAIGFVGLIGYYRPLKGLSNGFLTLLFLGILLAGHGSQGVGFFARLRQAFERGAPIGTPSQVADKVKQNLSSEVDAVKSIFNYADKLSTFLNSPTGASSQ